MSYPVAEILEVVPEELRRLSDGLFAEADAISGLDAAAEFAAAAGGMPGSDSGTALGEVWGQADAAFEAVSGRLRALAEVARGNARSYELADSWQAYEGES